ncbi:MAG: hypothetical protein ACI8T6_000834 [Candidatus Poseidoniaceae archaeon]
MVGVEVMDEVNDDSNHPWYHERVVDLEHEGWVTVSIEDYLAEDEDLASERLVYVDFAVELAQDLMERTSYLGDAADQRSLNQSELWEEELRDPMNAERVLVEYHAWAKDWRPWELILHNAELDWRDADKEDEYASLLARFDALDASSLPSTAIVSPLLAHPDDVDEIEHALSLLEEDEYRQRTAINNAATMLNEAGFDVGRVERMPIIEALDWITQLHDLHSLHEDLRLLIIEQIALFDPELAIHHEQRRQDLISQTSHIELNNFRLQIDAIADNLHQRLANLNDVLNQWRGSGIQFPHGDSVLPIELLEWETNLPEIEASIHIHLRALERWNQITSLWGAGVNSGAQSAGVLEETEQFIDHVDHLDQQWKQYELEAMMLVERYDGMGIVMSDWSDEILRDPRSALQQLKKNEHRFEQRLSCIEDLLNLDTSFGGGEDVDARIDVLKEVEVDLDVLQNTREMIETLAKRGARHRRMLEQDWRQLISQGKADDAVPTSSFTLLEFENEIGLIRRFGTSVSASSMGGSIVSGDIHQRLKTRTRQELATMEASGWGVQQLLREVETDVISTAHKINAFRPHVASYSRLIRRLSPLPWHRDVELALEVQEQLRDPTQLGSLSEKIPLLSQHLAAQKSENASFVFEAWIPAPIRKTLMPVPESYSRLTMVPKDALGDAHEAMLEAMEPETETSKLVEEELETKENITPGENSDREEEPDEVPEPLKTPPAVSVLIEPQKEQLVNRTNSADPAIYTNIIQFLEAINLDDLVDDLSLNGADSLPNVRRRIAQHVGIAPRDTRVDRMLRLALRLLPQNNGSDMFKSELLAQIGGNTKAMKRWMRARLENRHSGSSDIFLEDALNLGKALQRIPGPGFPLSLEADEYELPDADDVGRLEYEVKQLIAHMNLPSAGGIRVES